jgi:hypothetical protein
MDNIFAGVETILFCDESKFYLNNGDFEDATYYFAVSVPKRSVPHVNTEFQQIMLNNKVQAPVYHSTTVFRESNPREAIMNDITDLIIRYELRSFSFKYPKVLFFEPTKYLKYLNNDILNFEKAEFQALFYFLIILNSHLRDVNPNLLKKEIIMFFDRNVYGSQDTEAFNFPDDKFILKHMTFVEKSKVSLLCLPDFIGYIFRNSKKSHNKVQFGDESLETSKLAINSYYSLLKIQGANLFTILDFDKYNLATALGITL